MTDDLPELPQFSRNVAVLAERVPDRETGIGSIDHGVLSPFPGVLDVRVERGRIPMLDLSYLALEPPIAPGLVRSRGDGSEARPATPGPDAESTAASADTAESGGETDAGEPTVGEVVHGDKDLQLERHVPDLQRLALEDEGPPRTRVDFGPRRREHVSDPSSESSRNAPDDAGASFDAPASGEDPGLPERITRQRPADSTRVDRASAESTAFAPDRTVVDRSGPSFEGTDRVVDTPSSPGGPESTESSVVPRTVIGEVDGDAGRSPGRPGRAGGGQSADRDPDGTGSTADGPRMVVERSEDGSAGESGTGSDRTDAASSGDGIGRGPSHRSAGGDEGRGIGAVIEASTDPESRLVDRLYRALRERESIERRRRIGR